MKSITKLLPILFILICVLYIIVLTFFPINNQEIYQDIASPPSLAFPSQVIATQSRFSKNIEEAEQKIEFRERYVDDPDLELGVKNIIQEGKNGRKLVKTTITYYVGEEYSRNIEEEIIEGPVEQIIARGTKIVPKTIETDYGTFSYSRIYNDFWATSYDSTCLGCSTTTATGMRQGYGVVAVDPKVIPLYSKLYIPGYGVGIAGDVGGAVKGDKIDLGYDSLNGQWKAHYVDVYLLIN